MLKINYSKEFNRLDYYKEISNKYFYIKSNELLKKHIKGHSKKTITLKEIFEYFIKNGIEDFDSIFKDIKFKWLIIGRFETLSKIKAKIGTSKKIKDNEAIKFIFNYSNQQSKIIKPFFENNLLISTCYYCNIDFINMYNKTKTKKNKFTLDHFFDKSTYPYLALSLYNFIPSCYTCNSKLKKNEEFENISPSSTKYDFDEQVKFKIQLSETCDDLYIKNKKDIEIDLREIYLKKYKVFIEKMFLNERYEVHKDIVFEMIQKKELYPDSRLKELQSLTGVPYQQIKKDIFNLIDENEDLSKKPFNKLIKDISQELGLIK